MSDQLSMFAPAMFRRPPISSPASEDGPTPCDLPDGPNPPPCGPDPVPASPFHRPVNEGEIKTLVTYGRFGSRSSVSDALASSLASRLVARMALFGSMEYLLIWKVRATPARRLICALRASMPRTQGIGYIGWPTPQVFDSTDCEKSSVAMNKAMRGRAEKGRNGGASSNLREVAKLAGWRTPRSNDWKGGVTGANGSQRDSADFFLPDQANLIHGWVTPQASDDKNTSGGRGREKNPTLRVMAGWATPRAEDSESARMRHSRGVADTLTAQAGTASISSPDGNQNQKPTSSAVLNPAHSRWLQGYPQIWDEAIRTIGATFGRQPRVAQPSRGTVTPSSPDSPPSLSAPSSKVES